MEGPYRASALVVAPPIALGEVRRPSARWVPGVVGAVAAVATLVLGGPAGLGLQVGLMAFTSAVAILPLQRRAALRGLATLPFPVEHDRAGAVDPGGFGRSIHEIAIVLRDAPSGVELESTARELRGCAPALSAALRDGVIVVGGWRWGSDDVIMLRRLLARWGEAVHGRHPIARVMVTWHRGGPVATI